MDNRYEVHLNKHKINVPLATCCASIQPTVISIQIKFELFPKRKPYLHKNNVYIFDLHDLTKYYSTKYLSTLVTRE